ncbi:MAG: HupE/UreJ family protein [Acidobacteriota bacterium]
MQRFRPALWLMLAMSLASSWAPSADAHTFELTRTLLLLRADGTFQVDMTCDLDALALGAAPSADSAVLAAELRALSAAELDDKIAQLDNYFQRRVRVRFDDQPVRFVVSFPEYGTFLASEPRAGTDDANEPLAASVLGLTARLEGQIPLEAVEVSFRASRSFPPVRLTVLEEGRLGGRLEVLGSGTPSLAYELGGASQPAEDSTLPERIEVAGRYLALGFWHILPAGLDHILFVLGLFLLSARWRPLLWQVSAFTLAHTMTLALSTYGVLRLSPAIVEPLIALSIAYVAIENLLTRRLQPWRPFIVFAFGLLHGLGFAGVLGELGLPENERLAALLAFNIGVELGQLAVLVAAFALVGWLRHHKYYRRWVVVPGSLLIAAAGLYWAIERASESLL